MGKPLQGLGKEPGLRSGEEPENALYRQFRAIPPHSWARLKLLEQVKEV